MGYSITNMSCNIMRNLRNAAASVRRLHNSPVPQSAAASAKAQSSHDFVNFQSMPSASGFASNQWDVVERSEARRQGICEMTPGNTALLVIDMQRDFIYDGGFGSVANNTAPLKSIVPATSALLDMARQAGLLVVHTLESHEPEISDYKVSACLDQRTPEMRIGTEGPMGRLLVRGEYGNGIIDELTPVNGELVVYKPGKGAFHSTPMARILPAYGISTLIVAGVTTEVCVQQTIREANDHGYQCVMVEDCTESYVSEMKTATIDSIRACGERLNTWTANLDTVERGLYTSGCL